MVQLYRRVSTRNPYLNKDGKHIARIVMFRVALAVILVFAAFNPTNVSYLSWAKTAFTDGVSRSTAILMMIVGLLLAVGIFACLYNLKHFNTKKWWKVVVAGALISVILYGLMQWMFGWELWTGIQALVWITLSVFSVIFGIALAGQELKNLRRRLEGK